MSACSAKKGIEQSMRFYLLTLIALSFCLPTSFPCAGAESSPRLILPLDAAWRFLFADGDDSWSSAAYDDSTWERISLPHTWNNFDGQDGGDDYRRGTGWYRTKFQLPDNLNDRRVLVEFDAACKVADVFVNGKSVGTHTGAFARFRFDITDVVRVKGENLLAVRVNNSPSQIVPRGGDFTQFGGLYRPARLLLTAPVHIATLDYASLGVYLTERKVNPAEASVDVRVKLANETKNQFSGVARVCVRDAVGKTVVSSSEKIKLAAGENSEVTVPLTISKPRLWNGKTDPYQYGVTIELVSGNRVIDSIEQPLGLRSFEVLADKGFILNGNQVALHGVCRHQDRPGKGWAITDADHAEDFRLIQEIGANAIRLAHYQHDQYFYNLCDAGGMVVWAEFGFVNEPPETSAARENAKEQLRELIRQNYNHPSIFFWSIGNETSGKTNNPTAQAAQALLTELAAVVHEEDATRLSVYASHHDGDDPRNFLTDVIAFNKYFGWYNGTYTNLGMFLGKFHVSNPSVPVGISEYGAGASIYQHEENPPVRNRQARGSWHPEEWQTTFHEENWLQIKARPWLWGTFVWNMFDFSSDRRAEGDEFGRNDKGLVTYDRETRKDAFYWYQANWTTNPMVHIVSKRFWERYQPFITVKIYSNAQEVELKINGISLGKTNSADCRFVWPDIKLLPGPNRVEAYAYNDGKVVAADWGGWTYRADGDPHPNKFVADEDAAAQKKTPNEKAAGKQIHSSNP
jgi:beta-galactosidase